MRTFLAFAVSSLAAACSGSLNVIISGDAGPEASVVDAAVDAPVTYVEPACSSTPQTYVTVESIGGGITPILVTGGWLYWAGTNLYGTPLGLTANPVTVLNRSDVYQAFASDGTTLFFSSATGVGSVAIGSTSGSWYAALGGASRLGVDAQHLFSVDWSGGTVDSIDKTKLASATPQSIGLTAPSIDAGSLGFSGLAVTSSNVVVSSTGGNVGSWSLGDVVSFDKTGNSPRQLSATGAASVVADDTIVAWIDTNDNVGSNFTVDTALLAGGPVTKTGVTGSYLAQNASAFFASGTNGVYRIAKSDGTVTQLTSEDAGAIAVGTLCVYYYYYAFATSTSPETTVIHMLAAPID
jgi:hypothetical protein